MNTAIHEDPAGSLKNVWQPGKRAFGSQIRQNGRHILFVYNRTRIVLCNYILVAKGSDIRNG